MANNIGVLIVLVMAMIIGFVAMGFTAKAASEITSGQDSLGDDAKKNDDLNDAHKNATTAAVLVGICVGFILIGLLIYLLYKKGGDIQSGLQSAHGALSEQAKSAGQWWDQQNVGRT